MISSVNVTKSAGNWFIPNYFCILPWKIAKTRDHNETESEKYPKNINQSDTYF